MQAVYAAAGLSFVTCTKRATNSKHFIALLMEQYHRASPNGPWKAYVQVIRPALLREGFELIRREGTEVTDDVSIIEALGKPVKVTQGSYTNIKVTTPDDMSVAEGFLSEQKGALEGADMLAGVAA